MQNKIVAEIFKQNCVLIFILINIDSTFDGDVLNLGCNELPIGYLKMVPAKYDHLFVMNEQLGH